MTIRSLLFHTILIIIIVMAVMVIIMLMMMIITITATLVTPAMIYEFYSYCDS